MQHTKGEKESTADKLSYTNIIDTIWKIYKRNKVYNLYDNNISGAYNQVPTNPGIQKRLTSTMTEIGKKAASIVPGKINLDDGGH